MGQCNKKTKVYSETSHCDETNASAPCSVEYQLNACFPDDKGQTYPAANMEYIAHTPNGEKTGTLNSRGEVILHDVGIGSVTIEVLPKLEPKLKETRAQIKAILSQVIQEERAEAAKIAKAYNQKSYLGQVGENLKAEAKGVGNIGVGIWDGIKAIGGAIVEVGEQAGEYLLDPLHAPETFKEDVKAVKAKYYELKDTSTKALDIYQTLKDDKETWNMLKKFSEEYVDAQHSTELFEHGMEMVAGVIITVVTGGAAAAALGARFAAASARLAPLLEKLAKILKEKKWFKHEKTVQANKRHEETTVHKPYSKHRPSYRKGQVEETWENAKDRSGKVYDPNTDEELTWDKSKPRNGQWDMGHEPNEEYHKLHKEYMDGKISKEKFLKEYQDPNKYRPESVNANRGRKYEAK